MKQRYELEHFSGRLEEKIKQDCYEMMRVSNMLATGLGRRMKNWGRREEKKKSSTNTGSEGEVCGRGVEREAHGDTDSGGAVSPNVYIPGYGSGDKKVSNPDTTKP
jgi:hypothetical protein